ncbi:proline-rich receptor-like protein kinase PERK5 isoform X2 [Tasmannia lanceolata]
MEELQCNIVVMKRSQPKVLRLNLGGTHQTQPPLSSSSPSFEPGGKPLENRIKHSTPTSSPEEMKTPFTRTSVSSWDMGNSPFFFSEQNPLFVELHKGESSFREESVDSDDAVRAIGSDCEGSSPLTVHPLLEMIHGTDYRDSSPIGFERVSPMPNPSESPHNHEVFWIPQNYVDEKNPITRNYKSTQNTKPVTTKTLIEKFAEFDRNSQIQQLGFNKNQPRDYVCNSDVREAVSLCRNSLSIPPPLCSICQHKGPVFGKPPTWFSYRELDAATDGFSEANFLAEGGFGLVHRGVLGDGQMVAVKQLKIASSQGDAEFCAEVEVLSCAQHRNVVMLIGFCIEGKRRILVYEYICNGSLDYHLYGRSRVPLDWNARFKIAIGAARGLRYLHEDCRVGCIVHRDMRPNNILVTHDFEPLVGDFGLARWQPDGDLGVETRVIGTFGYLAPEYTQSGRITEKADVYAFGMVLLELITGRKAVDINRPKGQQFLAEWARPLLVAEEEEARSIAIDQILDPRLELDQLHFVSHQLDAMAHAASLCLRRDPHSRPRMSKIIRILEEDSVIDPTLDIDSLGNRNMRMISLSPQPNRTGNRSGSMIGLNPRVDSVGNRSGHLISLSPQPDSIGSRSARMTHLGCQQYAKPRRTHSHRLSHEALKSIYIEKETGDHIVY